MNVRGVPLQSRFPRRLDTAYVGGFYTVTADRKEISEWISDYCLAARVEPSEPAVVFSSNGHGIALKGADANYDEAMECADVIHADGMPVVFASQLFTKTPIRQRSATTDLFHDIAREALRNDLKFYVLGATDDQNLRAVKAMQELYPSLRIVGRRDGYFDEAEDEAVCAEIVATGADVVWVALGKPRQEIWCHRNRRRLKGVGCLKTCGGLYAFLTGDVERAPKWMQNLGVEWFFRLMGDPKRLFERYLVTNTQALFRLLRRTGRSA